MYYVIPHRVARVSGWSVQQMIRIAGSVDLLCLIRILSPVGSHGINGGCGDLAWIDATYVDQNYVAYWGGFPSENTESGYPVRSNTFG
ncbi:hypothetical protein OUZ56_026829 [Daphnia magna]|uniref:Uncharacterized protein n=1 Tax=Daphnia magna TaxID=35525 RepID=A0ABQ9ZNB1_9CRUS|nr:hypothetical protein OUZ56_026829 [Daphnia magna]